MASVSFFLRELRMESAKRRFLNRKDVISYIIMKYLFLVRNGFCVWETAVTVLTSSSTFLIIYTTHVLVSLNFSAKNTNLNLHCYYREFKPLVQ